ncbi:MAG TPA: sugar transferase [Xanthobacteraceae bacterium]|nr:sugar transferase [Xanthobacteraceae bacterium]
MRLTRRRRTSVDLPWVNLSALLMLWAVLAPFLALALRDPHLPLGSVGFEPLVYAVASAIFGMLAFLWYRLGHGVSRFFSLSDAVTIVKASAITVFLALITSFLITRLDNTPRSVPLLHFLLLAGVTIIARFERYYRRRRRIRTDLASTRPENILILGVTELSWFYIQIVDELAAGTYNVVALLDESRTLQGRYVHGYPVAGRISDLPQVINEYAVHGVPIDRVIAAVNLREQHPALDEQVRLITTRLNIPLDVLPDRLGLHRPQIVEAANEFDDPAKSGDPAAGLFWLSKRGFDIVVALLLLIVLSPVAGLVSFVVLLDCGIPVIFWQLRVGRYGRRITVYKFRTLKALYTATGEARGERERVSAIGRFLRLTHIDEMPQLFSILRGEMSFIGPRPLLPVDLSADAKLRLAVRPGLTGWAQVNGGTLLTVDEKNALDEWYVRHACWRLELLIAMKTVSCLFVPMRRNEEAIRQALMERGALVRPVACDSHRAT